MKYADRSDAGRRLAGALTHLKDRRPVVLALPRGGVAIGFEIAQALDAPLDIVLVRKIGVPWQPELALGAVTDGAAPDSFIDRTFATRLDISENYIRTETERQLQEIERRRNSYCADRPPIEIAGRMAIVADDGIATGATMRVALHAVRRRDPAWLVLAVPLAPPDLLDTFREALRASSAGRGRCREETRQASGAPQPRDRSPGSTLIRTVAIRHLCAQPTKIEHTIDADQNVIVGEKRAAIQRQTARAGPDPSASTSSGSVRKAPKLLGTESQRPSFFNSPRGHFMRNVLAYAGKRGRSVVAAFIATAFVQDDAGAARAQWRQVADQLRPKVPKLAALMDDAETDVLAFMSFPKSLPLRKRGTTG